MMHLPVPVLSEFEGRLAAIAPMGFTLAVNVRSLTPEFMLSTYPEPWVRIYADRRYMLFDPVSIWGRFNTGTIRWSEINLGPFTQLGSFVMDQAKKFGLIYGGGAARNEMGTDGTMSFLFGARSDREMTDAELADIGDILNMILQRLGPYSGMSRVELETLRDLAAGQTQKEIAIARQISPETVKKRLERARIALDARNAVHAVAIATKRGLILNDLPINFEK
ncbi:LuxR family transcriptional regulator [uncultured Paracoccus sp.]|uniref:helix-turn-helix transcriptional regulator n=1 Tax=uncultured Paracoccus sp. TaxID=189685 RepID=UPI0026387D59|nr:LuxR family transcriptional regulator [uncultured Paracoccus sp.]